MFVVSGNNKIYLVLEHYFGKSKKPKSISEYDILEFEPNTGIFNKKVIEASFASLGYTNSKSGFGSYGTIKDYIYYRGKLLVLSQYSLPFSSVKFYDTGLNMLDLETGDIIFLGALNIPAMNLRFIKDKNGKLYIASENYNYKEKIYRLNINNIDIKLKYFRKPKIVRYKDKLLVTYEYGNIFDGRYSGYKTNYGYYYSVNRKSRLNKLKEIYPFISDEYTLYKEYLSCWNYENDFIYSSSKGAIYKTNDNGSVFEELHKESMYENGGGFSYNYSSLYLTAFLKYDNNISILDNDKHITSTTVKANGSRDIVYLFNEFLIHIGYEDGKYIIDKYYYDGNLSSIIFKNIDNNSLISLSSINNKAVGVFGWNEGEPYIAIADLSKDIIAPTVSFINNDAKVEVGKKITLKWSASDNDNKLAKIELYQTSNGSEKLIKTFDDTKINQYEVTIPNIQGVVSYKVKAYDLSGNVGSDIVTFNVFKPIVLNSFFVDKTTLNLGEKIVFTWLSNGDSQTKYTIYKKEINSNKWSVLFEVKGVNSKVYEVKDFVGSYQFKIVSGNQELVFPQTVKINGEWLIFNYDEFYPKGEFIKDGSSIRLKWSDNSKEILTYEVWVKTIDDDNFKKIAVTSNKFFDYVLNKDLMFRWKIAANYKNKYIESNEIEAKPTKLLAPQINSIELREDSIRVSFTDVHNAKKYRIYRSTCNGIYKVIDEVETNYYQDYNIHDGICFSYKIVAIADNNIVSNFSNEKSINIGESEIYNVIIENENNSLINDNKIVLKYHPDRKVNFEKYEILIGINPKNMVTYLITDERNVTIENLSYNQTYYIEIYPLNINGKRLNIIPARLTFSTGFDNRKVTQKPIITVNEISNNYIVLSWNEVSNIDYYEIYRSEDGKSFEYIYKTNSTKFVDDINIESGKVYYYKIKALNSNSFSISDSVKVKTLENNNQECIQVITHAYNPQTGEEKDYASPCDVPEGWIIGNAPDNDGDGINDIKDTDDDNDGISDSDEEMYGLDSKDSTDANKDNDGDGISNIDEIKAGTDPLHQNIVINISQPIANLYLSPNDYIPPIFIKSNSNNGSFLEYDVTSSNPDVVVANINGNILTLTLINDAEGNAKITITATTGSYTKDVHFYVIVKRTVIEIEDNITDSYIETSSYDIETDNFDIHMEVIDDKHLFYQLKSVDRNTTIKVVIPGAKIKVLHDYTTIISLPTPKEANITIKTDGEIIPNISGVLLPKNALQIGTNIEVNETKIKFKVPMPEKLEF